jgi:hypothetical protein
MHNPDANRQQASHVWFRGSTFETQWDEDSREHLIVPRDRPVEQYDPASVEPKLYVEFSRLRTLHPVQHDLPQAKNLVTDFCHRFGPPWEGSPHHPLGTLTVEAITRCAVLVWQALRCYQLLKAGRKSELRRHLEEINRPDPLLWSLDARTVPEQQIPVSRDYVAPDDYAELRLEVLSHIERTVTAGFDAGGVRLGIEHDYQGRPRITYSYVNLLGVVWMQFYIAMLTEAVFGDCIRCDAQFEKVRSDQKYCSKSCRDRASSAAYYQRNRKGKKGRTKS